MIIKEMTRVFADWFIEEITKSHNFKEEAFLAQ
jgi:hypothetical protein